MSEMPTHALAANQVIDLEQIALKWLDFMRNTTRPGCFSALFKTGRKKFFPLSELEIKFNWDSVKFTQEETSFINSSTITKNLTKQTLFQTSYENRTNHEQESSFKIERETTQSYELTFNKGWRKETTVGIKIPFIKNIIKLVIPADILEFNGAMTKEIHTDCGQNDVHEEKIKWRCDTKVNVAPMSRAMASLRITEMEMERCFSGVMFIEGRLVVVLSHPKYGFVASYSGSMSDIFKMAFEEGWVPQRAKGDYVLTVINERRGVRANFGGVCKFRIGFNQMVEVQEEKVEEFEEVLTT